MKTLANVAQKNANSDAGFKKPDVAQFVPPEIKDAVDRISAAGMKIMYSEQMKDDRDQAINSPEPVPKKLSDNVVGLLLTMDQQAKGGLPPAALFPAAVMLLAEAGDLLVAAGQPVSQDDFNTAAMMAFAEMGKRMGGSPDQIMQAAGAGLPPEEQAGAAPPDAAAGAPQPAGGAPAQGQPMPQQMMRGA